jgi:hypothetical protein
MKIILQTNTYNASSSAPTIAALCVILKFAVRMLARISARVCRPRQHVTAKMDTMLTQEHHEWEAA